MKPPFMLSQGEELRELLFAEHGLGGRLCKLTMLESERERTGRRRATCSLIRATPKMEFSEIRRHSEVVKEWAGWAMAHPIIENFINTRGQKWAQM